MCLALFKDPTFDLALRVLGDPGASVEDLDEVEVFDDGKGLGPLGLTAFNGVGFLIVLAELGVSFLSSSIPLSTPSFLADVGRRGPAFGFVGVFLSPGLDGVFFTSVFAVVAVFSFLGDGIFEASTLGAVVLGVVAFGLLIPVGDFLGDGMVFFGDDFLGDSTWGTAPFSLLGGARSNGGTGGQLSTS